MKRQYRYDYALANLVLVDAPEEPTPTRAPATKTPEGYLVADAFLARDGLLKYSDGESSWLEYRPREELLSAASSWAHQPVTDDHPPVMVDATNATEYARGIVIETPRVVDADGVSYLRARIKVTDADLVAKILGGQTQLSIGFLADVHPERGTFGGSRYDAIQRELSGNHVASVVRGRAGPAVRILLDGACIAVHHESVDSARLVSETVHVTKPKTPPTVAHRTMSPPAPARASADEAGQPATETEITGPEGTKLSVPTWLAGAYEFAVSNGWGGLGAPKPETPEAAADEGEAPAEDPDKDKDKPMPPMTPDAVTALVNKARKDSDDANAARLALVRRCDRASIPADKIDACKDSTELARLYVATVTPHAKAIADKADGLALDALVAAAAAVPVQSEDNPWAREHPIKDSASEPDPEVLAYAEHLQRSGVR